ncbi:C-terminal binding protein [Nocardia sp. NBC_01009]|uniref:C-terminal binding protein n=1 Tax=Nocardia sp. NBC_01009 TaxID=2975996 RepID=UPI003864C4AE|nr:C-terminal binding protein [Nocardia sp. NBC_01009]
MIEKIVVIDDFISAPILIQSLAAHGVTAEVEVVDEIPAGRGIIALLVGPETTVLTNKHLDQLPDLRVLSATSAGDDHLPLQAAGARGLRVTRAAGYCTEEVADHALASILGLLRSTAALDAMVRTGRWDVTAAPPRRIAGTVLGIYGLGRVGTALAARARALGMTVLACGRSLSNSGELAASGVNAVELPELLQRSDVLSLHVPLTDQTRGLIDAAALAAMPPGSYLVNVARGELIDSAALGAALRSGHLAGAAIDVLPQEPPAPNDPILTFPNLVITPHAAWYSPEASAALARHVAADVAAVLAEPPFVDGRRGSR